MRYISLRSFALATTVLAVLIAGPIAAQNTSSQSPSEIRVKSSGSAVATDDASADSGSAATPAKPSGQVPTPAKRKADAGRTTINVDGSSPLPKSPSGSSAGEPLHPVPDPLEGAPVSVEAASFKGITPGASTAADVEKAWGKPKQTAQADGGLVHLYSVEPFKRVEVHFAADKVASIVIRLDRVFPADAVARQLDLAAIRSVQISNDLGEVLGVSYPERGVLFACEPSDDPHNASLKSMEVAQIVLEPISAEPFVIRAEAMLGSRYDLCRRDLDQAISLEPGNARAYRLRARAMAATEQHDKALAAAAKAVQLEPGNPHYRTTYAKTLAEMGQLSDAGKQAQKAIQASRNQPHVKAQATCLMGDLAASSAKPDFQKALALHTQAIELADPLTSDPHRAVRVTAKNVLIDAHLGAAYDIAWGEWKEKPKAVTQWLERAVSAANDLVTNDGGSQEQVFRVYARALAAYVGIGESIDPEPTVATVIDLGEKLIHATRDPGYQSQIRSELGTALYDAVQICQMRGDHQAALKHGQQAAAYLTKAVEVNPSQASSFLLGRLYFRMGTIQAMNNHDPKAAVAWFDKAMPLIERSAADELTADLGRSSEAFVGMGVSYWEVGQREKAVAMTQKGIRWMEQAVGQGTMDAAALADPYGNLAWMHRKLGANDIANHYQELANRAKAKR